MLLAEGPVHAQHSPADLRRQWPKSEGAWPPRFAKSGALLQIAQTAQCNDTIPAQNRSLPSPASTSCCDANSSFPSLPMRNTVSRAGTVAARKPSRTSPGD
jgi:hypothetical protein